MSKREVIEPQKAANVMRAGTRRDSSPKARSMSAGRWHRTSAANPKRWRPRDRATGATKITKGRIYVDLGTLLKQIGAA